MKLAQAIVLAGGLGTRLRSVVNDLPKPMADVNGRPFLLYIANYLKKFGIKEIILATGHMHEKIESYFGDGSKFGVKIVYSREPQPLGTGGAIKLASKFVSGRFLLVNGDTWFDCDLNELEQEHEKNKTVGTLALAELENTSRYGLVLTCPENKITSFVEKGSTIPNENNKNSDKFSNCDRAQNNGTPNASDHNKINAGYCILEPEILKYIPDGIVSLEKDVFPKLVLQNKLSGIALQGNFIDIGIPEDYFKFKEFAKSI